MKLYEQLPDEKLDELTDEERKAIVLLEHLNYELSYDREEDEIYVLNDGAEDKFVLADYESAYDEHVFRVDAVDYLVCADDEANEACHEYIKDSLWTFNASFIIENSELPYVAVEMIETFCQEKCEGANDTIYALVNNNDDVWGFVENAIGADGRGYFLNRYSGHEYECNVGVDDWEFYIYRQS